MSNLENGNYNIDFLTENQKLTENLRFMSCIEDICKNPNKSKDILYIIERNLNIA